MIQVPRTFVLTVRRPIVRFVETAAYLDSIKFPWERFNGFDNQITKLNPGDTFDVDRVGDRIGSKHIAACLSHYLLWGVMAYQPEDRFWVFEYDVRFADGWEAQYEEAMSVLPDDWDVVFLGSCCCEGRETFHVAKNLYDIRYPLCGHAIMYRKKCLETLMDVHQKIWAPLDISLFFGAWRKLRVYTIIPPIVVQHETPLPP